MQIVHEALPDAAFLQKDIRYDGQRHLIFATSQQLHLLCNSKTWYADGTFKCIRPPFSQLFSIHVFIRQGECMKQVPACFILMSRRMTIDYIKVISLNFGAIAIQYQSHISSTIALLRLTTILIGVSLLLQVLEGLNSCCASAAMKVKMCIIDFEIGESFFSHNSK